MVEQSTSELLVLGAGVIGLSCAWRAAQQGRRVTVLDPAPASGASWVAGGMLAPVTEAWPGEEELLALGVEAVARWPAFAAELTEAAGRPAGLRTDGTIVVATGSGDRAELDALAAHLARLGRPVERLSGRELRRLEPGLGPDVRGGLSVPDDLAVDNRALLAALRTAAERARRDVRRGRRGGRARRRRAGRRRPLRRRPGVWGHGARGRHRARRCRARTRPGCIRRCTGWSGR